MTVPMPPRHIRHDELELVPGPVTGGGGELRILNGSDYGLATSVMESTIAPGSGPRRHRHPHAEIFVLHDGQGHFEVEGDEMDAEPGDILIVPPDAWHTFTNSGPSMLRLTAIHEDRRAVTDFEDGTRRD
jgi:quercetin dioxygenase-like cupin family protein